MRCGYRTRRFTNQVFGFINPDTVKRGFTNRSISEYTTEPEIPLTNSGFISRFDKVSTCISANCCTDPAYCNIGRKHMQPLHPYTKTRPHHNFNAIVCLQRSYGAFNVMALRCAVPKAEREFIRLRRGAHLTICSHAEEGDTTTGFRR